MPQPVETISLRVLLFSALRDRVGQGELEVRLPAPATGANLLDALCETYPPIQDYRPVIRLAVNEVYAGPDVQLHAGDEVALITPVSGG